MMTHKLWPTTWLLYIFKRKKENKIKLIKGYALHPELIFNNFSIK